MTSKEAMKYRNYQRVKEDEARRWKGYHEHYKPTIDIAVFDIESKDPHIEDTGPGFRRNDAKVLCIAMYCPSRGIDQAFRDMHDPRLVEILQDETITKVGHNVMYDVQGVTFGLGIEIKGKIECTRTRMTLIDQYRVERGASYELDAICRDLGIVGKNRDDTIVKWFNDNIDPKAKVKKVMKNLDLVPWDIVAKYCLQDCHATFDLWHWQQPIIEGENLQRINDIEAWQHPWILGCKRTGLRVDSGRWQEIADELEDEMEAEKEKFRNDYGDYNINSSKDLIECFTRHNIPMVYQTVRLADGRIEKRPTFDKKKALKNMTHPIAAQIIKIKEARILLNTFMYNEIAERSYQGRIFPEMKPSKSDSGGTVTGRYASSTPNGQNLPARGQLIGSKIRKMFLPEEDCLIGAFDYKQAEYRMFAHFAVGLEGQRVRELYKKNPNLDYHQMTIDLLEWNDLGKHGRDMAKIINFGTLYGMGVKTFTRDIWNSMRNHHPDWTEEQLSAQAQTYWDHYWANVPFVRPTITKVTQVFEERGYVLTPVGRRERLPPFSKGHRPDGTETWDNSSYRGIAFLCSGAVADLAKLSIAKAVKEGIWDVLIPHLMVHDELVFSIPQTREGYDACCRLKELMYCPELNLTTPVGIDTEIGPDWGSCDVDHWNEFCSRFQTI